MEPFDETLFKVEHVDGKEHEVIAWLDACPTKLKKYFVQIRPIN